MSLVFEFWRSLCFLKRTRWVPFGQSPLLLITVFCWLFFLSFIWSTFRWCHVFKSSKSLIKFPGNLYFTDFGPGILTQLGPQCWPLICYKGNKWLIKFERLYFQWGNYLFWIFESLKRNFSNISIQAKLSAT